MSDTAKVGTTRALESMDLLFAQSQAGTFSCDIARRVSPFATGRGGTDPDTTSSGDRGEQDRRSSPVLVARIDRLAEATGSSRSGAIKRSILEATTPAEAQPVPDIHEVLVLFSEAARGGKVTAMRELLAYHREQRDKPAEFDPVRDLDERRRGGLHE